MNAGGDAEIDYVEINRAGLRMVITGAEEPYCRGWWQTEPPIFVEEIVYPDGSVDRWENGIPVTK